MTSKHLINTLLHVHIIIECTVEFKIMFNFKCLCAKTLTDVKIPYLGSSD